MPQEITTITLPLPFRLGAVNSYLIRAGAGFVLIDTGPSNRLAELEYELARAGCQPQDLHLILLTHGDFDHAGNAGHLRETFDAPVAMHRDDAGMVEQGDMTWNRSSGSKLLRIVAPVLFRFTRAHRFTPDLYVYDDYHLAPTGLDARVLTLPGHSRGSIGVLTAGGDLFCGDFLENTRRPATNSVMDNPGAGEASVKRLRSLPIGTVYPGHGTPFAMDRFLAASKQDRRHAG